MSTLKMQAGAKAPFYPSPFDTNGCVYGIIDAVEFMSWLTFN